MVIYIYTNIYFCSNISTGGAGREKLVFNKTVPTLAGFEKFYYNMYSLSIKLESMTPGTVMN